MLNSSPRYFLCCSWFKSKQQLSETSSRTKAPFARRGSRCLSHMVIRRLLVTDNLSRFHARVTVQQRNVSSIRDGFQTQYRQASPALLVHEIEILVDAFP